MLHYLEREFQRGGNHQAAQTIAKVHVELGRDVRWPDKIPTPAEERKEDFFAQISTLLSQVAAEYRVRPYSELVTETWRAFWREASKETALSLSVPDHGLTSEDLTKLEEEGDTAFFVPQVPLTVLGNQTFPWLSWSIGHPLNDQRYLLNGSHVGWRRGPAGIATPNTRMTEDQLKNLLKEQNREMMDLREYIILGLFTRLLDGKYVGEDWTHSRLSETDRHETIYACFTREGELNIRTDGHPQLSLPDIGGHYSAPLQKAA